MTLWALLIAVLSVAMVLTSVLFQDAVVQIVIAYLILLVALAILHRVWSKKKAQRLEILRQQLKEVSEENRRLRESRGEED